MTTPGHPDWAGTPLTSGVNLVFSRDIPIAAGASISQYMQFVKPGYLVTINLSYSGVSGAVPFARVHWQWEDANPANVDTGYQRWVLPVLPNGVYNPIIGSGPVRGAWLQVRADNLDGVQPVTLGISVYETTQHIARDDWRNANIFSEAIAPGFTPAPGSDMAFNILTSTITTVSANTLYMLPLYAGQAWLAASITVAAGATGQITIQPYDNSGTLYTSPSISATTLIAPQPVTLPRKPCTLLFEASAGNVTFDMTLTAMEYAS